MSQFTVADIPKTALPQEPSAFDTAPQAGDPALGIPQSSAAPDFIGEAFGARPWDDDERAHEDAMNEWYRSGVENLDKAVLDPETAFKGADLSFAADPDEARRMVINDSWLELNHDEPVAPDELQRRMQIQKVSLARFGEMVDSDEALFPLIQKDAVKRKDSRELGRELTVAAYDDAMLPSDQAGGFAAFREKIKTHAGYDPEREADYLEAWHETRRDAKERVDAFREPLVNVWRAFKLDGNVTAAAMDAYGKLTPEQRPEFMDALAIRAKALPEAERKTFWENMAKQTGLAVSDYGRNAAESATSMGLAQPTEPGVGIADAIYGTDNYSQSESGRLQAKKDFQLQRNFAADVRKIAREDYDPLKSAFGEGKPGFWEGVAYQAPGVTATSLTMAVPVVGMATMALSMEGSAYEQMRGRMLAAGNTDEESTAIAEGLAPFIAAPQVALEKVGFGLWSRKMPGLSKAIDSIGDQISNRLLRGAVKTGTIGTAETAIELAQDSLVYTVQDIAAGLSEDIPDVDWGKELAGTWASAPEIFFTMLPLSILGAAGGLSAEARNAAFSRATTTELQALGINTEGIAAINAANGPSSLASAVDEAWASRTPDAPEAQAAMEELRVVEARKRTATAQLENLGYAFPTITSRTDGTFSVFDGLSGDEIGNAPDLAGVQRLISSHTAALDDMSADATAELGTMLLGGKIAAEQGAETEFNLGRVFGQADAEAMGPAFAERWANQVALLEQAEGGSGEIARTILGMNTTEIREGQREIVNKVFHGGNLGTVFHEVWHGKRREAKRKGLITREDDIAVLRGFDTVLGERKDANGRNLRFIPGGLTDEHLTTGQIPAELIPAKFNGDGEKYAEELLDEAIAELAEMEIFRARKKGKSKHNLPRDVVTAHIGAVSRLAAGPASRFKAFIDAMRAKFGLGLARAYQMKKAEKAGEWDSSTYDSYVNKLLGVDEQVAHDAGVQGELSRILAMPEEIADDEIPFSIGRASTTVFDEASRPMANVQPSIGAFGRDLGMTGGNGWNSARGMSNNAAGAIDEGKMPLPEFKQWLADLLGIPSVSEGAIFRADSKAQNIFKEYHHMGRNRAEVSFYDPAKIEQSPKFFLGLADYYEDLKSGKKTAAAARKQALAAWKNLKQSLIDSGDMGDWKGSETKAIRNDSPRMKLLSPALQASVSGGTLTIDQAEKEQLGEFEKQAAAIKAAMDKRQSQIDKWTKKIEAGEKPPYEGYLASQEQGLAKDGERMAAVLEELQKRTPAQSAEAGRNMDKYRETSASGFESRQSLGPQDGSGAGQDASGFSLGPAQVAGILSDNALARITDPRRRTHVMSRIARDFNAMRLQIERITSLSGIRRSKGDLRREAAAREELAAEEKIGLIHQRFGSLLADEDLVKIKQQPVNAYLAVTRADGKADPFRGRLKSKAQAIKDSPDLFQLHRVGDYDGSDGVSRSVFGGNLMPDQAAQELFDNHLIKEPTADAMWEALLVEQNTVAKFKEMLVQAQEEIRAAKLEAKQEANEWLATQGKDQEVNFSDKEEIRRSLRMLDAILLALPAEIRGKIGGYTQISMIATDEARLAYLKDKLAKADKELETYLRVEYAKEWEALLAKAAPKTNEAGQRPTGSIAADAYDIFRIAEAAMGMSFAEGEAEADKWDAIADHPDTEEKDIDLARVKAQMIRLTMNWHAADAARREQAVLEGDKIYFDGLRGLAIENSRRRERLGKLRTSAIKGTGKTGGRMEREAARQAAASKGGELLAMRWEFLSFGQLVNVLFGEKSDAGKWFNAREIAASNAAYDGFQAKANSLESLFDTLSGNRFDGEKLRHRMATAATIKVRDVLGEDHTFTDSQAITFLLMWRQEDGKRHMEGIVDEETGQVVSTWGWDDKAAAAIESQLSREGQAVMAFLGSSYGEEYGRINDVFRRIWNVSMPRHKMYAPLSVNPVQGKGDSIMDPVSGDTMGAGMTPGSLKNRSFSAIAEPEFKDAFQVYLQHARQMEHFIAYGEFSRDALGVINRRETRGAILAAGGPAASATLSKWVDYFALGGLHDANMGSAWTKVLGGMLGRISQAALVGRVSVLCMQSLQLGAAAFKMPVGSFLTRIAKLTTGQLGWGDAIRSEYIQRRMDQMPPIVRDMMAGMASGTPNRAKFLATMAGRSITGADGLFTAGTYAIFYDYHLKLARQARDATPEATAHREAARLTDQVAQPTRTGARSWLEVANQGNPAFRAAWNFSSDPRQKMSLLVYEAMRRDISGGEKAMAVGKSIGLVWIVGGVLSTLLRTIIRDLRNDDDDEIFDERYWNPYRLALSAATGPLGAVPFLGGMLEDSSYAATGQFMPRGGMLGFLADAGALVPKWSKGKVDPLKDAETLATAGAGFSGTSAAAASAMHVIRDLVGLAENLEGPD
jgi:hypothetical protein